MPPPRAGRCHKLLQLLPLNNVRPKGVQAFIQHQHIYIIKLRPCPLKHTQGRLPVCGTICVVARELSNAFEWDMHLPLAAAAGVPAAALAALDAGEPSPSDLRADLVLARTVASELLSRHRLSEETWNEGRRVWGESMLVEVLTLVGYFAMVCWLMNVARTPGPTA